MHGHALQGQHKENLKFHLGNRLVMENVWARGLDLIMTDLLVNHINEWKGKKFC